MKTNTRTEWTPKIQHEKYELSYEIVDNYSMWNELSEHIEFLKTRMNLYGYKACTKSSKDERVKYTKEVLKLVEWGFTPIFYRKRSSL